MTRKDDSTADPSLALTARSAARASLRMTNGRVQER
jgi:hypothetical protein